MSSEPDERARAWLRHYHGSIDSTALLLAFDAGHSEGEKKGTAAGYLKALREVRTGIVDQATTMNQEHPGYAARLEIRDWLDRRIREAEENAK